MLLSPICRVGIYRHGQCTGSWDYVAVMQFFSMGIFCFPIQEVRLSPPFGKKSIILIGPATTKSITQEQLRVEYFTS